MTLTKISDGIYVDDSKIEKLNQVDAIIFDCDGVLIDITKSYDLAIIKTTQYVLKNLVQIDNAIKGLFLQKGIVKHLLLQPTHFLELKNFEMYLTCSVSGEQVYEKKAFKKPIERI